MSFLKNLSSALSGGVTRDEVNTATAAAGTSVTMLITGDPLTSGVLQLGIACCFDSTRNRGTMAGIGAATMLGLALGPVGGTLVTGGLLLCNRVLNAQTAELDAQVERVMNRASAYATK